MTNSSHPALQQGLPAMRGMPFHEIIGQPITQFFRNPVRR